MFIQMAVIAGCIGVGKVLYKKIKAKRTFLLKLESGEKIEKKG